MMLSGVSAEMIWGKAEIMAPILILAEVDRHWNIPLVEEGL